MSNPLSVLITTLNEVDQISDCIRSVEWADEIFLIDSFSTDGTVELVRREFPSVKVEQHPYLGAAAQKNYAIDKLANDWVLVVDADERVPPQLASEIRKVLEEPRAWAYSIGRRNFVLGEEIRFSGLQRDRVTRLFHRAHARYPNRRVHADLAVDGPLLKLREKYLHNYVRSIDHMVEKMTRYGVWGATQLHLAGHEAGIASVLLHPFARFIRDYIFNLGILDGTRGLVVVGMHVYYTFWKYVKLWELTELKRRGELVRLPVVDETEGRWQMPWEAPVEGDERK